MEKKNHLPIMLMIISSILFVVAIVIMYMEHPQKELENQTPGTVEENSAEKNDGDENQNSSTSTEVGKEPTPTEPTPKPEVSATPNPENSPSQTEVTPTPSLTPNVSVPTTPSTENSTSNFHSEEELISYFQQELNVVSNNPNQEDITLRERIKNTFISVVDFIFYDKEIRGYTFSELTTSAKLKIIEIALKIDNKIDEYFPNYKEIIKDKYTSIKGKLGVKYLEFTAYLCETVGEDTCKQAKEDFNTMKDSFATSWEFLKELASSGSSKIKEFYENWRDSE